MAVKSFEVRWAPRFSLAHLDALRGASISATDPIRGAGDFLAVLTNTGAASYLSEAVEAPSRLASNAPK